MLQSVLVCVDKLRGAKESKKKIEIFVTISFGFGFFSLLAHFYTHHSQYSLWRLLLKRICHFYHFSSTESWFFFIFSTLEFFQHILRCTSVNNTKLFSLQYIHTHTHTSLFHHFDFNLLQNKTNGKQSKGKFK